MYRLLRKAGEKIDEGWELVPEEEKPPVQATVHDAAAPGVELIHEERFALRHSDLRKEDAVRVECAGSKLTITAGKFTGSFLALKPLEVGAMKTEITEGGVEVSLPRN